MNKNDVFKLAAKCGAEQYSLGKREAYLNQGRYSFDHEQLLAFAKELTGEQEPVGSISFSKNGVYINFHPIKTLPDGNYSVYTIPPSQAERIKELELQVEFLLSVNVDNNKQITELEAECARYKAALTQITYSHDVYAKDAAEKALGKVE